MVKILEINQLKYFLEVCNSGSMARAAEKLHITQQGISIAIRRLESETGKTLFFHKSKGLVLTPTGVAFRDEAEIIISHINKLYDLCRDDTTGKANITVAILKNRITKLPSNLQKLLITPPNEYNVTVINDYSNTCADMVFEGNATFGLVYDSYSSAKFDIYPLEMVKQIFVVSKNNPLAERDSITINDLDGIPLLLPDPKTRPFMQVADMFKQANAQLNIAYECNWPHQAIDIVADNPSLVARTLLDDMTEQDYERVKTLPLSDSDFAIPFNLLVKKGRKLSVHEQLFKHLILDCYSNRA